MTSHTPFRSEQSEDSSPFAPKSSTPFGSGSPFGASSSGSSPFGAPSGGPLRPRRRGIGPGVIIAATVIPVIITLGIFVWAQRSADDTRDQVLDSVQDVLDDAEEAIEDVATPAPVAPAAVAATTPEVAPTPEVVAAPEAPATPEAPVGDLLADSAALDSVVGQVAAAVGDGDLRVLSALLYPEYASLSVQDPAIAANVDNYTWRGGQIGDPQPVELVGDGDLEAALYGAAEVDWTAISALVAEAPAAVSVEDGVVTHVMVERALPFSSDIRIRVFVSGTRDSGFVDGAADGTMISINGN